MHTVMNAYFHKLPKSIKKSFLTKCILNTYAKYIKLLIDILKFQKEKTINNQARKRPKIPEERALLLNATELRFLTICNYIINIQYMLTSQKLKSQQWSFHAFL